MDDRQDHSPPSEEITGAELQSGFVRQIQDAIDIEDSKALRELVEPLHIADLANVLELLPHDDQVAVFDVIRDRFDPELLLYTKPEVTSFVLEQLGEPAMAQALQQLEADESVSILEELNEDERRAILQHLSAEARTWLEEGLSYPEESVGRLMRRRMVLIPKYWTVGNTIDFLRSRKDLPDEFYNLFIVNPKNHPVGSVLLSQLVRNPREVRIDALMQDHLRSLPVDMDQEEASLIFRKYGLVAAPVVNAEGRMLGVLTIDDMVEVLDEEADEDLLRMGGVFERDFYSSLGKTVKRRFPWLFINLLCAFASSSVVRLFEDTIAGMVALAALMPIVASLGGNSGIQAVTVSVRALATKELVTVNSWRAIGKESFVGLTNGLVFAAITFGVVYLWNQNLHLAMVFACAIAITLTFSGMMGATVPILLNRLGADPAVSSGVFLTTMTDATAFFVFLGIASLLL